MALNARIGKLVVQAMKAVGDLRTSVTYSRVTLGIYDPVTDTRATTVFNTVLQTVLTNISDQEVDYFPVDIVTQRAIIAGNDLPFVPEVTDYIIIGAARWEVKRVRRIPGDSLYIVYIQEA